VFAGTPRPVKLDQDPDASVMLVAPERGVHDAATKISSTSLATVIRLLTVLLDADEDAILPQVRATQSPPRDWGFQVPCYAILSTG
jgi:hypothetical protein